MGCVKVTQLCPTLCHPMDYTVHGILQARILEWVAFPFSRGSSQPRDRPQVSHIAGGFFTNCSILYQLSYQGNPLCRKRLVNICSTNALSCWTSLSGLISKHITLCTHNILSPRLPATFLLAPHHFRPVSRCASWPLWLLSSQRVLCTL